jgi:hypothetical protein
MKTSQLSAIAAALALLGTLSAPAQATSSAASGVIVPPPEATRLADVPATPVIQLADSGSDRKNDGLDDGPDAPDVDDPDDNGIDAQPHARVDGKQPLLALQHDGLDDAPDAPDVDGPDDNGVDA